MLLFPEYLQKKHKKIKKKIKNLIQKGGQPYKSELDIKSRFAYSSSESFLSSLLQNKIEINEKLMKKDLFDHMFELNIDEIRSKSLVNPPVPPASINDVKKQFRITIVLLIIILLQKDDYVSKFSVMLNNNNIRTIFNMIISSSPKLIECYFDNTKIKSHESATPIKSFTGMLPSQQVDINKLLQQRETFATFFKEIITDETKLKLIMDEKYFIEFKIIILLQVIFFKDFNLIDFYISFRNILHRNNFVNILLSKIKILLDLDYIEKLDHNYVRKFFKNSFIPFNLESNRKISIWTIFANQYQQKKNNLRNDTDYGRLESSKYKKRTYKNIIYKELYKFSATPEEYNNILIYLL